MSYKQIKEKQFEIDDYDTDELVGENAGDIDGGSREEVNTVAQADLDSIRKSLEEFMERKVEDSLHKKIVDGQTLQSSSITFSTIAANFDKALDEEADELTLTMIVEGSGIAYDESLLDELMNLVVKDAVPDEFDLTDENIEYEIAATPSVESGVLDLQVKLKSFIAPKINEAKIRNDLTGMRVEEAQGYIDSLNDIESFEIVLSPRLPAFLMRLPVRKENIVVQMDKK